MLFVGRARELDDISTRLELAAAGRGSLVCAAGEPGIGKTRLADAAATKAEALGFRVGWGRAWESGGAPAYYPWTQVFEAFGLRLPDASTATAVDPEAARFQLFRNAAHELRRASSEAPRLVVLDDLHVADVSSLLLLLFVARELRTMRIVVLATFRDVEARLTPASAELLARIAREGSVLSLRRLERADVDALVRGSAASDAVSNQVEDSIWRSTQGNPLFVEEVLRLLAADASLARAATLPIPHGVREVIRQRLGLLDEAAAHLLDVAAVIGVDFEVTTLCATARASIADASAALARAHAVGVVVDAGEGRHRFGHALMREAIYNDLPATKRLELHAAAADALERSRAVDPPLTEIAHHALLAGPADADRLVERAVRAARALATSYAHEDAVRLLERADAVLATLPDEVPRASELWLELGQARMRAGDVRGGTETCLRAAARARATGDAPLLARAALIYGTEFTIGATDTTLRALLEEARDLLSPEHRGLRARIEARLAASLQPSPDPEGVAAMACRAIADARELGDEETLLEVLHTAGAALNDVVLLPDGRELWTDAVRLATKFGDRNKLLRAYLRLVFQLVECGDWASADAYIDAYETVARATGQARYVWPVPMLRSMRPLLEGRFRDAETLASEAREIMATIPDPSLGPYDVLFRYHRARAEERAADLIALEPDLLAKCAPWNAREAYGHLFQASVRSAVGDLATAQKHLDLLSLDSTPGRIRVAVGMLSLAVVECGDRNKAAVLYERLLPSARLWVTFGWGGFFVDSTYARVLGGMAAILGRFDAADAHFEEARTIAENAGAAPELARTLVDHGLMLLARGAPGDAARAEELFARARPIAAELGLSRLATKIPASAAPAADVAREARADASWSVTLAPEGDTWVVAGGSSTVRLKDSRGLHYIAKLVAEPGREVHALDLAGASGEADTGDAGEALDPEARGAYKKRLAELDEDVRDAEAAQDRASLTRARAEIEFLSAELSRAFGLGGKSRRVGSAVERARVAVTRRIRETIRRIAEQSPELGRHLERSVKTGTFCSYDPT